jgi:hypothetical protein
VPTISSSLFVPTQVSMGRTESVQNVRLVIGLDGASVNINNPVLQLDKLQLDFSNFLPDPEKDHALALKHRHRY